MKTIGIIGANGQVATEVCLFLSRMDGIRVVPICRTELSTAFLSRCGLECRYGRLGDPEEARELLAGCDLVVDASLPKGRASEQRKTIRSIIRAATKYSPPPAGFVYFSTVMALGMSAEDARFRYRWIARTVYGATKRYGERLSFRLGSRSGRDVWVLRLGQVHGVIQEVSRGIRNNLVEVRAWVPDEPSWTVFTLTVAEALRNIALGMEKPGRYVLVSTPPWSWKEVLEFYCEEKGFRPDVTGTSADCADAGWCGALWRRIKSAAIASLTRTREVLVGNLLWFAPAVERWAAARYSLRRAQLAVAQLEGQREYRPFAGVFRGIPQGHRLQSLLDTRTLVGDANNNLRTVILGAVTRTRS